MELLIYLILFLLVLIVSSTTNKLLPFLPLPLVQILLGIVIGLFLPNTDFHLNTELFLALVIGPLLFRESEEADITAILKHWRIIIYLIFPVIFISTLSLGGLAHLLWFSLPLAACLAVGAALGPTDLVAFASLSERFSFPKRGHYSYFKTLANYYLSHISSDFHLDTEFGWLGSSSLVQPPLGSLFGCWGGPWPYGLGGFCFSFGAF